MSNQFLVLSQCVYALKNQVAALGGLVLFYDMQAFVLDWIALLAVSVKILQILSLSAADMNMKEQKGQSPSFKELGKPSSLVM